MAHTISKILWEPLSLQVLLWFGLIWNVPPTLPRQGCGFEYTWSPAGSTIWERYGSFRRQKPAGGSTTLEVSFEVVWPGPISCFFLSSWLPSPPHTSFSHVCLAVNCKSHKPFLLWVAVCQSIVEQQQRSNEGSYWVDTGCSKIKILQ
jgi:hypothetical protein